MTQTLSPVLPIPADPEQAAPQRLPMAVDVDSEDILLGVRRNSAWCPIARSIRRTFALAGYDVADVRVEGLIEIALTDGHSLWFRHDGQPFYVGFDCSAKVEPITVHLTPLMEMIDP